MKRGSTSLLFLAVAAILWMARSSPQAAQPPEQWLQFSAESYAVAEGAGTATITITRESDDLQAAGPHENAR